MPSGLPSSFASAAAGQNANRGTNGGRSDGRGSNSGEWPRQRSTNGTLTFRRPSTTPSNQQNQVSSADAVQLPPSVAESTSTSISAAAHQRYSREELLSIFESTNAQQDVSTLFTPGWNPGHVNGNHTNVARGWGKSSEPSVLPQEPDICWDSSGGTRPSHIREMTAEERELFSSDVNSPVKPPTQQQNKDNVHASGGLNGRKTSVSHGASANFSVTSPTSASRPGTRRRETADTNPFSGIGGGLTSPTAGRGTREEPSFWLGSNFKKSADGKDGNTFEEPEEDSAPRDESAAPKAAVNSLPFGGLIRSQTASATTGFAAASTLWGQPAAPSPTTSTMGGFGNFALPGSSAIGERRPGAVRGESRLAHLIPKDSSENMSAKLNEPMSAVEGGANRSWRPRPRTDTDPFGGDDALAGSAVLGGAQDNSPPTSTQPSRAQAFDTPVKGNAGDFGMAGLNLGSEAENAPMSPSDTNPFRSPPGERGENDDGLDRTHGHAGLEHSTGFSGAPFAQRLGQPAFDGSDRSQTSSVGARVLPTLNNLAGWPSSGTPDRDRAPAPFSSAFGGNSVFAPLGEPYSPGIGHPGSNIFGPPSVGGGLGAAGSIGRGSRLGSLLPAAMHSQTHVPGHDTESLGDSLPDLRQANPLGLGAIGRTPFGEQARDTDSPIRASRGPFSDMFGSASGPGPTTSDGSPAGVTATAHQQGFPQSVGTPFGSTPSGEPALAQNRVMVMPDRMRWVYLDPQGQQQGPFTGLEMNDWYKAHFFTPDLSVKRVEDAEFEPLGQLIRRIGNSREPFLVPQIGIPHGPPTQGGPFSPGSGAHQPPLVGAFPSFGRTLTAQEQNDLERRKQEEQFLQAQQREFNQHRLQRGQIPGQPLQHHSSAHSLQSQPSFGSMSGIMPQGQAPIGPVGGGAGGAPFFGAPHAQQPIGQGSVRPTNITDLFREEELARLSSEGRQVSSGFQGSGSGTPIGAHLQQPIGGSSADLRSRLPSSDDLMDDNEGFRGRLQEFEKLRAQHDADIAAAQRSSTDQLHSASETLDDSEDHSPMGDDHYDDDDDHYIDHDAENSLGKQFERAQAQSANKKSGYPQGLPPPKSSTPLPAPAPQRIKSNLPEQYASASRPESPADAVSSSATAQAPALAPWAKETSESHRGPSLREIQEAEAKQAAKLEKAAAAERRALAEQEAAREREKAAAAAVVAPGLPNSSTWAASPVSAAPSSSPWTKPAATKGVAPGFPPPSRNVDKKQTLADIQREEEEKRKALAAASQIGKAAAVGVAPAGAVAPGPGIRYADKAGKPNALGGAIPTAPPGVGWSTVGAGGKVKVPTGPAAQVRTASSGSIKPTSTTAAAVKPVVKTAGVPTGASGVKTEAMASFNQWVHNQLTRGGVIAGTDINGLAQTLLSFPLEASIISEAVYATSTTINGHDFATEYIRRKKLADKGVVDKQDVVQTPTTSGSGGWNEVAKKSSAHKEVEESKQATTEFKVVPGRKKSKK